MFAPLRPQARMRNLVLRVGNVPKIKSTVLTKHYLATWLMPGQGAWRRWQPNATLDEHNDTSEARISPVFNARWTLSKAFTLLFPMLFMHC